MLRVTTIHARSAGASARYYTRYLTPDDGGEAPGRWLGRQADALGLSGVVATEDLEALLSGYDPTSGARLGSALVDRYSVKGKLIPAVAGFDATFSAPKSLSVWWGLTGDPGLLGAHDIAVRAVLDHLERFGATTRVRVSGSRQFPDTEGLTMAVFRQSTSREDDPQLHTHVVISTKVQGPDGRWLALDARYLKRKQRALGGLYQAVLRAELSHRYGVAWGPVVNGQAEIVGMPAEVLEVFSKRTEQVNGALACKVEEFKAREGRDPTRWERAALTREAAGDTRSTKTSALVTDLRARWRDEVAELGWTPQRVVASMRHAVGRSTPAMRAPTVEDVLEQLSVNGSTWTRAEVLQAICDLVPPMPQTSGRRWAKVIDSACDRVVAGCVTLDPPSDRVGRRWSDGRSVWIAPIEPHLTHERILAQEERILVFAFDANDEPARPSRTLHRNGMDVMQADAAAAVAGHDRLVLVVGPAGTGKTTALARAVSDLQPNRIVFGVAPTAKAASVLAERTGMDSDTVAKLLHEWRSDRGPADRFRLDPGATLVVDEAGMLGTGALDDLTTLATAHQWRLVLVGDPRQLQAVGRGGMFDELCRTGRVHELATIHRFRHSWENAASLALRAGHHDVVDTNIAHVRVRTGSFEEHLDDVADLWIAHTSAGRSLAVTAETNDHVDALNAAIQRRRRELGTVDQHHAARISRHETASVGDLVVTRRNDRTLLTDRGEPVHNRELWQVTAVRADGSLTVSRMNGHGAVTLPADYVASHVQLGYAATAHGHQGGTVDVGIALITGQTSHRSLYVAATRGRDENQLRVVTVERDLLEARDVLEQVLTNERADVPAVAQRQHLASLIANGKRDVDVAAECSPEAQRLTLVEAERSAEPFLKPVRDAQRRFDQAEASRRRHRAELDRAPMWRRRRLTRSLAAASAALEEAQEQLDTISKAADPHLAAVEHARAAIAHTQHEARLADLRERLERADERDLPRPTRGRGVETGGLER